MTKRELKDIEQAAKEMGLNPFEVDFHIVPADVLYDIAARMIPGRYSHWSHGKNFWDGITRHNYRFGRLYELVINTDPCQAFLLDTNSEITNLMVQAHVFGHSDFMKNNREFQGTDRQMHISAPRRAERIRNYEQVYGEEEVRKVLDSALTVQFYVTTEGYKPEILDEKKDKAPREFDDIINIDKKEEIEIEDYDIIKRFAGLPCDDLLDFLTKEAPVEGWKKDIMAIVRKDGLYFWPQIRTKITNEGWASFIHQKIMRGLDLKDHEFWEYAEENANVVSAAQYSLNPYWLGVQIFKDIEKKHGFEEALKVRKMETDSTFLRNHLTEDLIDKMGLIRFSEKGNYYVVKSKEWQQVRNGLINDLTDRFPDIYVADKDYENGGLLLKHRHHGRNLKKYDAVKVLQHLKEFWKKDVYLETYDNKQQKTVTLKA